jgi:hypothetical protein
LGGGAYLVEVSHGGGGCESLSLNPSCVFLWASCLPWGEESHLSLAPVTMMFCLSAWWPSNRGPIPLKPWVKINLSCFVSVSYFVTAMRKVTNTLGFLIGNI